VAATRGHLISFFSILPQSFIIFICYNKEDMAQKKRPAKPKAVLNRRARFDYELGDEIVAGVALTGPEVRAARDGHVQLRGSYVTIRNGELWLNNASFSLKLNQKGEPGARTIDTEPKKLLARRKQIDQLAARRKDGMTIVPTKLLTTGRFIKLVIALGKGKKRYDKRETLKRRDQERDAQRAIKNV
jgi:SsrA-binding protein